MAAAAAAVVVVVLDDMMGPATGGDMLRIDSGSSNTTKNLDGNENRS